MAGSTESSIASSSSSQTTIVDVDCTAQPIIQVTPSTPAPRGRISSRYPSSLARGEPGRVPLHRRGTSKTYERLEDLLREAGYKETRVFTPESERTEARSDERRKRDSSVSSGVVRDGVNAVVDFLAGWIPGASKPDAESPDHLGAPNLYDSPSYGRSLPPSPLLRKMDLAPETSRLPPSPLGSPRNTSASPRFRQRALPDAQHGRLQLTVRPASTASGSLRTYAQVSAAKGYLRTMASVPNMRKQRSAPGSTFHSRRSTNEDHGDRPAMPTRWLESVTKAVVGQGSSDAYIGGPTSYRPSSRPPNRLSRQTSTLSGHSGKAGSTYSHISPAANMTAYLLPSQALPSAVTTVRVVCRSAPASRSSSRLGAKIRHAVDRTASHHRQHSKKPRTDSSDVVPSLAANLLLENDSWGTHWVDGKRVSTAEGGEVHDDDDDSSDDEVGELDLARILVPPKRQHSIRSLRKHLHRCDSARALRSQQSRQTVDPFSGDDEGGVPVTKKSISGRNRSRRGSLNEGDDHQWLSRFEHNTHTTVKRRRAQIPGGWNLNLG